VDIGYKSEGVISAKELSELSEEEHAGLQVGAEVEVYVTGTDEPIRLSIRRAKEEEDWQRAEVLLEEEELYEGEIGGYNKGGLIVKVGRLRGFIPGSQVSMARRMRSAGDSPEERWGEMVGEPIVVKVIEVDRRQNRLILSERAAAREARDLLKERLIDELQVGEARTGRVVSLAEFGAFVDIGGADGLVHTSEISWKRIGKPSDVLEVGQEVRVKVLAVDRERKRISLSLRQLSDDPWEGVTQLLEEGQLVEATITKLTKFGAFARLHTEEELQVEGLVHVSELAPHHVDHPGEILNEGQQVTLRVIRIEPERRRIGLSLKRVDSPEYASLDWRAAMDKLEHAEEEATEPQPEALAPGAQPLPEQPGEDLVEEPPVPGPNASTESVQDMEEEASN
jgi:small subunit ribosomal protein S1